MARADRHAITWSGRLEDTVAWLHRYGYLGFAVGAVGSNVGLLFWEPDGDGVIGLAAVGHTLRWDGRKKKVVVEVSK